MSVVGANFNMKYLHPEGIEHFHTEAGFLTSEAGLITYAAVGGGALVLLVVLIPVLIVIYFRRWMLAKEAADLHPNTGGNQAIRRLDNPPAPGEANIWSVQRYLVSISVQYSPRLGLNERV